jgi:hypothetical protein
MVPATTELHDICAGASVTGDPLPSKLSMAGR